MLGLFPSSRHSNYNHFLQRHTQWKMWRRDFNCRYQKLYDHPCSESRESWPWRTYNVTQKGSESQTSVVTKKTELIFHRRVELRLSSWPITTFSAKKRWPPLIHSQGTRDAGNDVTLQMQKKHKKQMNSTPSVLFQHMTILMSAQWSKNEAVESSSPFLTWSNFRRSRVMRTHIPWFCHHSGLSSLIFIFHSRKKISPFSAKTLQHNDSQANWEHTDSLLGAMEPLL